MGPDRNLLRRSDLPGLLRAEARAPLQVRLAEARAPVNDLAIALTCHHISPGKNAMADVANRYPENTTGKYYVDNQCIDCDLCRETAPDNFKRNDDGGYSFVYKQPENDEEEARCKEAKEGCPVEAIGDNGI